jgi:valyl-tRNA synthetase
VTEEVWSWWQPGSVHQAPWPEGAELTGAGHGGDPAVLDVVSEVLGQVRRAKTGAKRSMRAPVAVLTVTDDPARLTALSLAEDDLRDAGGVVDLVIVEGDTAVDVVLADEDRAPAD